MSRLRATKFGEFIFLDHGVVKVGEKTYCFLLILDAATTFITAYPVQTAKAEETIQRLHEWMDTYFCVPGSACADMAFHMPVVRQFFRSCNIRPVPTGPATPWPNRAEAGVRLFKKFMKILLDAVSRTGLQATPAQVMRKACCVRNQSVTYGGVSPMEMVFGRRPPAVVGLEQQD